MITGRTGDVTLYGRNNGEAKILNKSEFEDGTLGAITQLLYMFGHFKVRYELFTDDARQNPYMEFGQRVIGDHFNGKDIYYTADQKHLFWSQPSDGVFSEITVTQEYLAGQDVTLDVAGHSLTRKSYTKAVFSGEIESDPEMFGIVKQLMASFGMPLHHEFELYDGSKLITSVFEETGAQRGALLACLLNGTIYFRHDNGQYGIVTVQDADISKYQTEEAMIRGLLTGGQSFSPQNLKLQNLRKELDSLNSQLMGGADRRASSSDIAARNRIYELRGEIAKLQSEVSSANYLTKFDKVNFVVAGQEIANTKDFTPAEIQRITSLLGAFGINTNITLRAYDSNGALLATHVAGSMATLFSTDALTAAYQGTGNQLMFYQQAAAGEVMSGGYSPIQAASLAAELRNSKGMVLQVLSTNGEVGTLVKTATTGNLWFSFSNGTELHYVMSPHESLGQQIDYSVVNGQKVTMNLQTGNIIAAFSTEGFDLLSNMPQTTGSILLHEGIHYSVQDVLPIASILGGPGFAMALNEYHREFAQTDDYLSEDAFVVAGIDDYKKMDVKGILGFAEITTAITGLVALAAEGVLLSYVTGGALGLGTSFASTTALGGLTLAGGGLVVGGTIYGVGSLMQWEGVQNFGQSFMLVAGTAGAMGMMAGMFGSPTISARAAWYLRAAHALTLIGNVGFAASIAQFALYAGGVHDGTLFTILGAMSYLSWLSVGGGLVPGIRAIFLSARSSLYGLKLFNQLAFRGFAATEGRALGRATAENVFKALSVTNKTMNMSSMLRYAGIGLWDASGALVRATGKFSLTPISWAGLVNLESRSLSFIKINGLKMATYGVIAAMAAYGAYQIYPIFTGNLERMTWLQTMGVLSLFAAIVTKTRLLPLILTAAKGEGITAVSFTKTLWSNWAKSIPPAIQNIQWLSKIYVGLKSAALFSVAGAVIYFAAAQGKVPAWVVGFSALFLGGALAIRVFPNVLGSLGVRALILQSGHKALGLYQLGTLVSWTGAGLWITYAIYAQVTGKKIEALQTWGIRLLAGGFILRAAAGTWLWANVRTQFAQIFERDYALKVGMKTFENINMYINPMARQAVGGSLSLLFWQQASRTILMFRMFPTVQAISGIDHIVDALLSAFGAPKVLTVDPITKKQKSFWQHVTDVLNQNWWSAAAADPQRILHDVLMGQMLHIMGVTYQRGMLGNWSMSQAGLFKGFYRMLSPNAFQRQFAPGIAQAFSRRLLSFFDNVLLFNVFLAPAQAMNRLVNGIPKEGGNMMDQILKLPKIAFALISLPIQFVTAMILSMNDFANLKKSEAFQWFVSDLNDVVIFLVPQAEMPSNRVVVNEIRTRLESVLGNRRAFAEAIVWEAAAASRMGREGNLIEALDRFSLLESMVSPEMALKMGLTRAKTDLLNSAISTVVNLSNRGENVRDPQLSLLSDVYAVKLILAIERNISPELEKTESFKNILGVKKGIMGSESFQLAYFHTALQSALVLDAFTAFQLGNMSAAQRILGDLKLLGVELRPENRTAIEQVELGIKQSEKYGEAAKLEAIRMVDAGDFGEGLSNIIAKMQITPKMQLDISTRNDSALWMHIAKDLFRTGVFANASIANMLEASGIFSRAVTALEIDANVLQLGDAKLAEIIRSGKSEIIGAGETEAQVTPEAARAELIRRAYNSNKIDLHIPVKGELTKIEILTRDQMHAELGIFDMAPDAANMLSKQLSLTGMLDRAAENDLSAPRDGSTFLASLASGKLSEAYMSRLTGEIGSTLHFQLTLAALSSWQKHDSEGVRKMIETLLRQDAPKELTSLGELMGDQGSLPAFLKDLTLGNDLTRIVLNYLSTKVNAYEVIKQIETQNTRQVGVEDGFVKIQTELGALVIDGKTVIQLDALAHSRHAEEMGVNMTYRDILIRQAARKAGVPDIYDFYSKIELFKSLSQEMLRLETELKQKQDRDKSIEDPASQEKLKLRKEIEENKAASTALQGLMAKFGAEVPKMFELFQGIHSSLLEASTNPSKFLDGQFGIFKSDLYLDRLQSWMLAEDGFASQFKEFLNMAMGLQEAELKATSEAKQKYEQVLKIRAQLAKTEEARSIQTEMASLKAEQARLEKSVSSQIVGSVALEARQPRVDALNEINKQLADLQKKLKDMGYDESSEIHVQVKKANETLNELKGYLTEKGEWSLSVAGSPTGLKFRFSEIEMEGNHLIISSRIALSDAATRHKFSELMDQHERLIEGFKSSRDKAVPSQSFGDEWTRFVNESLIARLMQPDRSMTAEELTAMVDEYASRTALKTSRSPLEKVWMGADALRRLRDRGVELDAANLRAIEEIVQFCSPCVVDVVGDLLQQGRFNPESAAAILELGRQLKTVDSRLLEKSANLKAARDIAVTVDGRMFQTLYEGAEGRKVMEDRIGLLIAERLRQGQDRDSTAISKEDLISDFGMFAKIEMDYQKAKNRDINELIRNAFTAESNNKTFTDLDIESLKKDLLDAIRDNDFEKAALAWEARAKGREKKAFIKDLAKTGGFFFDIIKSLLALDPAKQDLYIKLFIRADKGEKFGALDPRLILSDADIKQGWDVALGASRYAQHGLWMDNLQREGYRTLREKVLNAPMGSGKTLIALTLAAMDGFNVYMVPNKSLLNQVFEQANKYFKGLGIEKEIKNGDALIDKVLNNQDADANLDALMSAFRDSSQLVLVSQQMIAHLRNHLELAGGRAEEYWNAFKDSVRLFDEVHLCADPLYFIVGGEVSQARSQENYAVLEAAAKRAKDLLVYREGDYVEGKVLVTEDAIYFEANKKIKPLLLVKDGKLEQWSGNNVLEVFRLALKDQIKELKSGVQDFYPVELFSILKARVIDYRNDSLIHNKILTAGGVVLENKQWRPRSREGKIESDRIIEDTAWLIGITYLVNDAIAHIESQLKSNIPEKTKAELRESLNTLKENELLDAGGIDMTSTVSAVSMFDLFETQPGGIRPMGMTGTAMGVQIALQNLTGRLVEAVERDKETGAFMMEMLSGERRNIDSENRFDLMSVDMHGWSDVKKAAFNSALVLILMDAKNRLQDARQLLDESGHFTDSKEINSLVEKMQSYARNQTKFKAGDKPVPVIAGLGSDLAINYMKIYLKNYLGDAKLLEINGRTLDPEVIKNEFNEAYKKGKDDIILLTNQLGLTGLDYQAEATMALFDSRLAESHAMQALGRVGRTVALSSASALQNRWAGQTGYRTGERFASHDLVIMDTDFVRTQLEGFEASRGEYGNRLFEAWTQYFKDRLNNDQTRRGLEYWVKEENGRLLFASARNEQEKNDLQSKNYQQRNVNDILETLHTKGFEALRDEERLLLSTTINAAQAVNETAASQLNQLMTFRLMIDPFRRAYNAAIRAGDVQGRRLLEEVSEARLHRHWKNSVGLESDSSYHFGADHVRSVIIERARTVKETIDQFMKESGSKLNEQSQRILDQALKYAKAVEEQTEYFSSEMLDPMNPAFQHVFQGDLSSDPVARAQSLIAIGRRYSVDILPSNTKLTPPSSAGTLIDQRLGLRMTQREQQQFLMTHPHVRDFMKPGEKVQLHQDSQGRFMYHDKPVNLGFLGARGQLLQQIPALSMQYDASGTLSVNPDFQAMLNMPGQLVIGGLSPEDKKKKALAAVFAAPEQIGFALQFENLVSQIKMTGAELSALNQFLNESRRDEMLFGKKSGWDIFQSKFKSATSMEERFELINKHLSFLSRETASELAQSAPGSETVFVRLPEYMKIRAAALEGIESYEGIGFNAEQLQHLNLTYLWLGLKTMASHRAGLYLEAQDFGPIVAMALISSTEIRSETRADVLDSMNRTRAAALTRLGIASLQPLVTSKDMEGEWKDLLAIAVMNNLFIDTEEMTKEGTLTQALASKAQNIATMVREVHALIQHAKQTFNLDGEISRIENLLMSGLPNIEKDRLRIVLEKLKKSNGVVPFGLQEIVQFRMERGKSQQQIMEAINLFKGIEQSGQLLVTDLEEAINLVEFGMDVRQVLNMKQSLEASENWFTRAPRFQIHTVKDLLQVMNLVQLLGQNQTNVLDQIQKFFVRKSGTDLIIQNSFGKQVLVLENSDRLNLTNMVAGFRNGAWVLHVESLDGQLHEIKINHDRVDYKAEFGSQTLIKGYVTGTTRFVFDNLRTPQGRAVEINSLNPEAPFRIKMTAYDQSNHWVAKVGTGLDEIQSGQVEVAIWNQKDPQKRRVLHLDRDILGSSRGNGATTLLTDDGRIVTFRDDLGKSRPMALPTGVAFDFKDGRRLAVNVANDPGQFIEINPREQAVINAPDNVFVQNHLSHLLDIADHPAFEQIEMTEEERVAMLLNRSTPYKLAAVQSVYLAISNLSEQEAFARWFMLNKWRLNEMELSVDIENYFLSRRMPINDALSQALRELKLRFRQVKQTEDMLAKVRNAKLPLDNETMASLYHSMRKVQFDSDEAMSILRILIEIETGVSDSSSLKTLIDQAKDKGLQLLASRTPKMLIGELWKLILVGKMSRLDEGTKRKREDALMEFDKHLKKMKKDRKNNKNEMPELFFSWVSSKYKTIDEITEFMNSLVGTEGKAPEELLALRWLNRFAVSLNNPEVRQRILEHSRFKPLRDSGITERDVELYAREANHWDLFQYVRLEYLAEGDEMNNLISQKRYGEAAQKIADELLGLEGTEQLAAAEGFVKELTELLAKGKDGGAEFVFKRGSDVSNLPVVKERIEALHRSRMSLEEATQTANREWKKKNGYRDVPVPTMILYGNAAERLGHYWQRLGNDWAKREGASSFIAKNFGHHKKITANRNSLFARTGFLVVDQRWVDQSLFHEEGHILFSRPELTHPDSDIPSEEIMNFFAQLTSRSIDLEVGRAYDIQKLYEKYEQYEKRFNLPRGAMRLALNSIAYLSSVLKDPALVRNIIRNTKNVQNLLFWQQLSPEEILAMQNKVNQIAVEDSVLSPERQFIEKVRKGELALLREQPPIEGLHQKLLVSLKAYNCNWIQSVYPILRPYLTQAAMEKIEYWINQHHSTGDEARMQDIEDLLYLAWRGSISSAIKPETVTLMMRDVRYQIHQNKMQVQSAILEGLNKPEGDPLRNTAIQWILSNLDDSVDYLIRDRGMSAGWFRNARFVMENKDRGIDASGKVMKFSHGYIVLDPKSLPADCFLRQAEHGASEPFGRHQEYMRFTFIAKENNEFNGITVEHEDHHDLENIFTEDYDGRIFGAVSAEEKARRRIKGEMNTYGNELYADPQCRNEKDPAKRQKMFRDHWFEVQKSLTGSYLTALEEEISDPTGPFRLTIKQARQITEKMKKEIPEIMMLLYDVQSGMSIENKEDRFRAPFINREYEAFIFSKSYDDLLTMARNTMPDKKDENLKSAYARAEVLDDKRDSDTKIHAGTHIRKLLEDIELPSDGDKETAYIAKMDQELRLLGFSTKIDRADGYLVGELEASSPESNKLPTVGFMWHADAVDDTKPIQDNSGIRKVGAMFDRYGVLHSSTGESPIQADNRAGGRINMSILQALKFQAHGKIKVIITTKEEKGLGVHSVNPKHLRDLDYVMVFDSQIIEDLRKSKPISGAVENLKHHAEIFSDPNKSTVVSFNFYDGGQDEHKPAESNNVFEGIQMANVGLGLVRKIYSYARSHKQLPTDMLAHQADLLRQAFKEQSLPQAAIFDGLKIGDSQTADSRGDFFNILAKCAKKPTEVESNKPRSEMRLATTNSITTPSSAAIETFISSSIQSEEGIAKQVLTSTLKSLAGTTGLADAYEIAGAEDEAFKKAPKAVAYIKHLEDGRSVVTLSAEKIQAVIDSYKDEDKPLELAARHVAVWLKHESYHEQLKSLIAESAYSPDIADRMHEVLAYSLTLQDMKAAPDLRFENAIKNIEMLLSIAAPGMTEDLKNAGTSPSLELLTGLAKVVDFGTAAPDAQLALSILTGLSSAEVIQGSAEIQLPKEGIQVFGSPSLRYKNAQKAWAELAAEMVRTKEFVLAGPTDARLMPKGDLFGVLMAKSDLSVDLLVDDWKRFAKNNPILSAESNLSPREQFNMMRLIILASQLRKQYFWQFETGAGQGGSHGIQSIGVVAARIQSELSTVRLAEASA